VWSAHTLVLGAAFGGVLVCIGLLAWLVFRKSEPHYAFRFVALFAIFRGCVPFCPQQDI
jgi:hypothetical protein